MDIRNWCVAEGMPFVITGIGASDTDGLPEGHNLVSGQSKIYRLLVASGIEIKIDGYNIQLINRLLTDFNMFVFNPIALRVKAYVEGYKGEKTFTLNSGAVGLGGTCACICALLARVHYESSKTIYQKPQFSNDRFLIEVGHLVKNRVKGGNSLDSDSIPIVKVLQQFLQKEENEVDLPISAETVLLQSEISSNNLVNTSIINNYNHLDKYGLVDAVYASVILRISELAGYDLTKLESRISILESTIFENFVGDAEVLVDIRK